MWIVIKGLIALLMVPLLFVGFSLITHISVGEDHVDTFTSHIGLEILSLLGFDDLLVDLAEMNEQSRLVGGLFFLVVPGLLIWRLGFWNILTFIRTMGRRGELAVDEY